MAVFGRLTILAICLAFLVSFALPCLCLGEAPASHDHCGGSDGGFKVGDSSCCCGGALPGASETMAKLIPTPMGTPMAVGMLPASLTILRSVSAAPAGRPGHGPPVLVLRI